MIQKLKSMKANQKGFTLAELLIVVAILAILAAIAIPVFSTQLDKARQSVDTANANAITHIAVADAMLEEKEGTYYGKVSSDVKEVEVQAAKPTTGYNQAKQDSIEKGKGVYEVTVDDKYHASGSWVAAGTSAGS